MVTSIAHALLVVGALTTAGCFTDSGGGCDVDENGAVNAMGTSYVMCM